MRKIDRQTGQESRFRVLQLAALSAAIALLISLANSTIVGQQNRTWSHVQTTARNSGADSNSLAFASATQAGNVIIAEVDWSDGFDFVSISDSQGNVYTQIGAEQYSSSLAVRSRLYYTANIVGGANTMTTSKTLTVSATSSVLLPTMLAQSKPALA